LHALELGSVNFFDLTLGFVDQLFVCRQRHERNSKAAIALLARGEPEL
jgi:hypothetical protein